jgi:hypothetical protein
MLDQMGPTLSLRWLMGGNGSTSVVPLGGGGAFIHDSVRDCRHLLHAGWGVIRDLVLDSTPRLPGHSAIRSL